MGEELQAYGLLAGTVLLLAALALLLLTVAGRVVRAASGRVPTPEWDEPAVVRRCDACGKGWLTVEGHRLGLIGLLARRAVRRLAARLGRTTPTWALPKGWNRCPSCLSRRVRVSGESSVPVDGGPLWPVLLGLATTALGLLFLTVAAGGLLLNVV